MGEFVKVVCRKALEKFFVLLMENTFKDGDTSWTKFVSPFSA